MSGAGKPGGQAAAPVNFAQVWIVSQAGGVGATHYATINAALDAIAALPPAEQPTSTDPHIIEVHPGTYDEFVWLPDWVWLQGIAPVMSIITGEVVSGTGKAILSVGQGGAENLVIQSVTSSDATAGVFVRNATSIFTIEEGDFGTISNGDTLIITPQFDSQETFTFAGTETTAQNVVDLINATAVELQASVRLGRVEIIKTTLPNQEGLLVHKEGTANAALGFSTTVDTSSSVVGTLEVQILDTIVINQNIVDGLLFSDLGGGTYIADGIFAVGASGNGVHLEADCNFSLLNPLIILNGNGVNLEANSTMEIESGRASLSLGGDDVVVAAGATLTARNFAYDDRSGPGDLIPSGTRLSFVWEVVGNLTTGVFVDGGRVMPFNITIESVSIWRGVAGTPATTLTIDLNKAGSGGSPSTLYTTQANRPAITSTGVNNIAVNATLPDILQVAQGQFLSMDIDTVEAGLSQNFNMIVTGVVN